MNITFEKANHEHIDIIFSWLAKPHMMEFWDNSQEHKDDILNFIHGRQQHYFYGTTKYWIGSIDNEPYCIVLSDLLLPEQDLSDIQRVNLSKTGHTITIDFGIGNKNYLGKGLASPTLEAFVNFYYKEIDNKADTFFIDPDESNPRAQHVYSKAGFELAGCYNMQDGAFKGQKAYLMVKRL
jgi:RimJ/RimL family protein N-acetyltransferase